MPETTTVEEADLLDRRLGYVLTSLNILGAVLALGYMVVAVDEMTGGALRREWDRRLEAWKKARVRSTEYARSLRRVEFEAWRALQEANDE